MQVLQAPIVLILTIVTPPDKPDVHYQRAEESLEVCLKDAKEFLEHGTPKIEGVLGVMAACLVHDKARGEGTDL